MSSFSGSVCFVEAFGTECERMPHLDLARQQLAA